MSGDWPTIEIDPAHKLHERRAPERHSEVLEKFGLWLFHYMTEVNWGKSLNNNPIFFCHLNYVCISHLIDGDGVYMDQENQRLIKLVPGDVVISTPKLPYYLSADQQVYHEDFISFCGPVAEKLMDNGLLEAGIYSFGRARLLLPIIKKLSNPTMYNQISAGIDLLALLNDIHFGKYNRKNRQNFSDIKILLEEIEKDSQRNWDVASMAEFCSLNLKQFRKLFKSCTGTLPKQFLDSFRMNEAARLMVNSSLTLAELAAKYHYSDAFHFSRAFKRVMGMSPSEFRRDHSK